MFVLSALNKAIPFVLIGWGEQHIASGLAAILNATTPIWGVVIAHFFTRDERMSPRKLAGVILGFGGVVVMMGPSILGSIGTSAVAQLAVVFACLSYALAAVWARRFKAQGISPLGVTAGQLTAGAIMMLPMSAIVDRPWTQPLPSLQALGAIAGLALVCSAFAYVLYFRLIATSGATNAMLVTLLAPPVAMLLGAVVLGEQLGFADFAGLALIAVGLAAIDGRLLSLGSKRSPQPAA
jgi:drug/metabolite transporter (DMT)-like permease